MKFPVRRVSDIAAQIRGVTYRKHDASNTPREGFLPVLRAGNITNNGITFDDLVFVPSTKVSSKQLIRRNDILIAASSGSIDIVGKAARLSDDFNGGFGAFCKVLRLNEDVDPAYFAQFFKTPEYRRKVSSLAAGVNINNLRNEDLDNLEIPLPPLPEQKRIAEILDLTDTLRAKRRESLVQLDALVQTTFIDMFGDPVNNPMGWPSCKIGELFDVARGGSPRPIERFLTSSDEGINWIMIGDAPEGSRYINSTKKKILSEGKKKSRLVKPGDFLLTNSMSFGRPYILKTHGCIHDGWLVLSPKDERIQPDYFYNLLCTDALYREFSRRAAGAVVKNLNINLVKGISVACPPRELQHRFSTIVESAEQERARLRAHLAELDVLFASLQSRAFNGGL